MTTPIKTKLQKKLFLLRSRQGFSLVELLVVIAVIGIIAAIAIPNIAGITDSAKKSGAQRNAQNIASVISSAAAAGATMGTNGANTVLLVTTTGLSPTDGAFIGKVFSVPNISGTDLDNAKEFLDVSANPPTYNPNATFVAN